MNKTTRARLESLLPTKSPHICFTTYLPLVPSFRENDWERNVKRVELHKKLVNIELNHDDSKVVHKNESWEKLGRGHRSGSRRLLEDFLTQLDLENYQVIGKTLYKQKYLNDLSARTFLLEASEIIDGERMSNERANELLEEWK